MHTMYINYSSLKELAMDPMYINYYLLKIGNGSNVY